jgi:hypothetical protein
MTEQLKCWIRLYMYSKGGHFLLHILFCVRRRMNEREKKEVKRE